jgi:rubrerythrin
MAIQRYGDQGQPSAASPAHRFRCVNCSYGATRAIAPERCPMCGGSSWEFESWRPFSQLHVDLFPAITSTEHEAL